MPWLWTGRFPFNFELCHFLLHCQMCFWWRENEFHVNKKPPSFSIESDFLRLSAFDEMLDLCSFLADSLWRWFAGAAKDPLFYLCFRSQALVFHILSSPAQPPIIVIFNLRQLFLHREKAYCKYQFTSNCAFSHAYCEKFKMFSTQMCVSILRTYPNYQSLCCCMNTNCSIRFFIVGCFSIFIMSLLQH